MKNATQRIKNSLPDVLAVFDRIVHREVLVGVPADHASRDDDSPMNNALLAYIHDNGAPEANIPARPFMKPGIKDAQPKLAIQFKLAAQAKDASGAERYLIRAGFIAQNAIRARINEGIPPPLKPGTIMNRWRSRQTISKRKGEKEYAKMVKAGISPEQAQSEAGIKALVNTGQLRNSITFIVRDRK